MHHRMCCSKQEALSASCWLWYALLKTVCDLLRLPLALEVVVFVLRWTLAARCCIGTSLPLLLLPVQDHNYHCCCLCVWGHPLLLQPPLLLDTPPPHAVLLGS